LIYRIVGSKIGLKSDSLPEQKRSLGSKTSKPTSAPTTSAPTRSPSDSDASMTISSTEVSFTGLSNYDSQGGEYESFASSATGDHMFMTQASAGVYGVWRSSDYGANFELRDLDKIPSSVTCSKDGKTVYAFLGAYQGCFYKSEDYGESWSDCDYSLTTQIKSLGSSMSDTGKYVVVKGYSYEYDRIFVSSDYGSSWTETLKYGRSGYYCNRNIEMSANGKYIYSINEKVLYKSSDYGVNFETITLSDVSSLGVGTGWSDYWSPQSLLGVEKDGKTICQGTSRGLILSKNRGKTWEQLSVTSAHDYMGAYTCSVSISGKYILAGGDYGTFLSDDQGKSFAKVSSSSFSFTPMSTDGSHFILKTWADMYYASNDAMSSRKLDTESLKKTNLRVA